MAYTRASCSAAPREPAGFLRLSDAAGKAAAAPAAPVVFVTGAAGGIGRAVVGRCRARGWRVFGTDLALAMIPCGETDFVAASLDVTSESAIAAALEQCLQAFGRLDHVVHLAGRTGSGPLTDVSLAQWRELIELNLTSAFLLARACHAALRATQGSLTLTASTNAINGGNAISGPAYAVAKAGIVNLTRYLAREWAPDRIRVNALAPGPIDTPMLARLDADMLDQLRHNVPLGRLGEPADVANAVDYLLARESGFITGTVMNVSGGLVLD